MAAISTTPSFSGSPPAGKGASSAPSASFPPAVAGESPDAASCGTADDTSGAFMLLLAEMMGGGAEAAQPGTAPWLEAFAGAQSAAGAGGSDADMHTDTDSDTEREEASELAMAVLFPGISCLAPDASASGAAGSTADARTGEISSSLAAARTLVDASQAALDTLANDTSDAASKAVAPSADSTSAGTQPTNTAHMHALLASHSASNGDQISDGSLRSPLGTPAWRDELGTQLTWMANSGRDAASLRLSPDHLGPLEVRISVRDGTASVWFGAANADTRSALEQSLPRLREMFASQGLVLADAGVFRDAPRDSFKPAPFSGSTRTAAVTEASTSDGQTVTHVALARLGLVDTYV